MHQTTVRFSSDLWRALQVECRLLGISAAQYVREAALARMAYTAGQRGDSAYEVALDVAGARIVDDTPAPGPDYEEARVGLRAALREASGDELAATAVGAQSELVLARARDLRQRSAELRRVRTAR
jgi:hypothetical protein